MSLETFYEVVDGDLAGVRGRLLADDRIAKFVDIFLSDTTYVTLIDAIETQDEQTAFRAAHTLKGLGRDMGFNNFGEAASNLTEALRPNEDGLPAAPEDVPALLAQVKENYEAIVNAAKTEL